MHWIRITSLGTSQNKFKKPIVIFYTEAWERPHNFLIAQAQVLSRLSK